ncbi:ubiquitin carboxyl-terminal hydrolase, family 1 protein [Aspergillus udagawae]|uniref:Ubiquitin carboxyl-terminal hydrolase n=1 Tax=Aspergillus udagawae TaxID=91492 RepID=A0ABQ1AYU0_9EURO|nr:ubiquitin carboxyl-terminal hydrolase, family 1 protein [Aspergillus udagawae]GFF59249.1 ubiquitin carboxyl-terminal hydrolase, family 1 protein [Aspergillus udagawae]GFF90571.1 ubiquitin carboxyl-terminal hydrolase, family 1 protein [Aspergillus udagawae]GFG16308.1 ubiquitin carboxyl-terminal hydrolase, family 1 protein [Aspergillus udagawae]
MSQRNKRRRVNTSSSPASVSSNHTIANPSTAAPCNTANVLDRQKWNGFCELESEPAIFNVMLREFGVKGVKVQEVVSLDDELMAFLNKPVYGLIFLFRWREDDPDKQEASCPEGLWFANQTASNACASVALLNIVNNIEGIDLGENLRHFREFTMPFTPALRGDAINNFEFVKRIHNSFARRMDILNSDLQLKVEATSKRSRSGKNRHDEFETDAGFHFIAFVPALGKVWKFDGLERQPQALGEYAPDEDWLTLVRPNILTRMAEYEEDQIEFSILSVAKDPLVELEDKLAVNVKCLEAVNRWLASREEVEETCPGPECPASLLENTILGPDSSFNLARHRIEGVIIPPDREVQYAKASAEELRQHQYRLSNEQRELRASILEEQQSHRADDDYATGRRFDYGPAVRAWIRLLARKRIIESLT